MNTLRCLALFVVVSCAACAAIPHPAGAPARPYATGDLTLLVHYTAKESCSCIFVQQMSEEFCRAYTKANPAVASWSVDAVQQTVSASALGLWSAQARFIDDQTGCILDP